MAHTTARSDARDRSYIPAAGHDALLPFYDAVQWILGGHRVRAAMLEAADVRPGMRVLDVGCGTGSFVVQLARARPGVEVTGLDPDPLALGRARRKLERAALAAHLDQGFADAMPYADGAFDRVFSSFMFHHLPREGKQGMLREVHRVLAPGGTLHLADFGGAGHAHGLIARLVHRHEELADNFDGAIPRMIEAAGFGAVREVSSRGTLLGPVTHHAARRAAP